MSSFDRASVPAPSLRVRRRRVDGRLYLILDNYYFELDAVTDAIWRASDGRRSLGQIAEALAEAHGCPTDVAFETTIATLDAFAEHELLTLGPADAAPSN